jgi:hypothetical protein
MDTATQVLVIIVSTLLSIFLLVGIIVSIKLYQLLKKLKHIAEQAEKVADSAEHVGDFFRRSAGPVALSRMVINIIESVQKHGSKKGRG